MKARILAFLVAAVTILITARSSSGGEWSSVGAPRPEYYTQNPQNFICALSIFTSSSDPRYKGKVYHIAVEHEFQAGQFMKPGNGFARFELKNVDEQKEGPGFNDGHWISLGFSVYGQGQENLELMVGAKIGRTQGSTGHFSAPRAEGLINGRVDLQGEDKDGYRSVSVEVRCWPKPKSPNQGQ